MVLNQCIGFSRQHFWEMVDFRRAPCAQCALQNACTSCFCLSGIALQTEGKREQPARLKGPKTVWSACLRDFVREIFRNLGFLQREHPRPLSWFCR
jgi:hypothetical protein